MKIRATPGWGGRARSRLLKASSPPAEAPIATIGKFSDASGAGRVARFFSLFLGDFFLGAFHKRTPRKDGKNATDLTVNSSAMR
jgi:hypothetical protein